MCFTKLWIQTHHFLKTLKCLWFSAPSRFDIWSQLCMHADKLKIAKKACPQPHAHGEQRQHVFLYCIASLAQVCRCLSRSLMFVSSSRIRNPDRNLHTLLQSPIIKNDSWYIFMTLLIDCSHLPINYSNLTDGKKRSNLISILVNFLSAQCNKKRPEILM